MPTSAGLGNVDVQNHVVGRGAAGPDLLSHLQVLEPGRGRLAVTTDLRRVVAGNDRRPATGTRRGLPARAGFKQEGWTGNWVVRPGERLVAKEQMMGLLACPRRPCHVAFSVRRFRPCPPDRVLVDPRTGRIRFFAGHAPATFQSKVVARFRGTHGDAAITQWRNNVLFLSHWDSSFHIGAYDLADPAAPVKVGEIPVANFAHGFVLLDSGWGRMGRGSTSSPIRTPCNSGISASRRRLDRSGKGPGPTSTDPTPGRPACRSDRYCWCRNCPS
jgi:hypothetical protein